MKNFIQEGKVISFLPLATYASGSVVLLGSVVGIVTNDYVSGDSGEALVEGIVEVTKAPSQAWTIGQKIYWDAGNSRFTTVSTSNTYAGYATVAVADGVGDVLGKIHLNKPVGDTAANAVAANVTALGATADLTAVPGTFADEAAVQTYLVTLRSEVEARLDAIEGKVDAEIAALKSAGLQASS